MADKPAKLSKEERKIRSNLAKSSQDVTAEMIKQVKVGDNLDKILGSIFQNENKIAKLNKDLND